MQEPFHAEANKDEKIELQDYPTEIMEADLLTKALSKNKVDQHRRILMGYSQFNLSGGVDVRPSQI